MITNTNLDILYEDDSIIVCKKPAGIATQTKSNRELDLLDLIKRHLYMNNKTKSEPYVSIIHRLDQPVSGLLVFGKTEQATKSLNKQLQNKGFQKHYKALLSCTPIKGQDTLIDYMKKDGKTNTSSICNANDPNAKKAQLSYNIIGNPTTQDYQLFEHCNIELKNICLVHIQLDTGRHHQIRLQMANMGCPIVGDTKYNANFPITEPIKPVWQYIALCAYHLEFSHPLTNKKLQFTL